MLTDPIVCDVAFAIAIAQCERALSKLLASGAIIGIPEHFYCKTLEEVKALK